MIGPTSSRTTACCSWSRTIPRSPRCSSKRRARQLRPHAITLDIRLPDISGWRLLSQLKNDLATRHIPVHVISVHEDLEIGLNHGALGVAAKPLSRDAVDAAVARLEDCVARPVKNLLLIEDDD